MKKKDERKYFFSSMGLTLCFCFVLSMFLTADYNNRKLSGQSVSAESSLVEKINKSDSNEKNDKITDNIMEKIIFPLEEIVAKVSDKVMEFVSSEK